MLKLNGHIMNKNGLLVCRKVKFYCQKDKEAFFEWIQKLEFIERAYEDNKDIILELCNGYFDQFEIRELIALFRRYKINKKELQKVLRPQNRRWFLDRKAYWYKGVFGEKGAIIKNGLIFGPLNFFSAEDKELFLDWVQAVRCLESYRFKQDLLYANLYSTPITLNDLKNLMGIFQRYNLENPEQLKERFGTEDNEDWFKDLRSMKEKS